MQTFIKGPIVTKYHTPNGFFVSKMFKSVSTNDPEIAHRLKHSHYTENYDDIPPFVHTVHSTPLPQYEEHPYFPTPSAPPLTPPINPHPTSAPPLIPFESTKQSTPTRYGVTLEEIQSQKQKIKDFECPPGTKRQGLKCLPVSEFLASKKSTN